MPSGKTHDVIGLACTVPVGLLAYQATKDPTTAMVVGSGVIIGTLWLSPDLDIPRSRPLLRWGALRFLWYPYERAIPHRSKLSHSFLGFPLKLAYLSTIATLVCLCAALGGWYEPLTSLWEGLGTMIVNPAYLSGFVVSDALHIGADGFVTGIKRSTRKKRLGTYKFISDP